MFSKTKKTKPAVLSPAEMADLLNLYEVSPAKDIVEKRIMLKKYRANLMAILLANNTNKVAEHLGSYEKLRSAVNLSEEELQKANDAPKQSLHMSHKKTIKEDKPAKLYHSHSLPPQMPIDDATDMDSKESDDLFKKLIFKLVNKEITLKKENIKEIENQIKILDRALKPISMKTDLHASKEKTKKKLASMDNKKIKEDASIDEMQIVINLIHAKYNTHFGFDKRYKKAILAVEQTKSEIQKLTDQKDVLLKEHEDAKQKAEKHEEGGDFNPTFNNKKIATLANNIKTKMTELASDNERLNQFKKAEKTDLSSDGKGLAQIKKEKINKSDLDYDTPETQADLLMFLTYVNRLNALLLPKEDLDKKLKEIVVSCNSDALEVEKKRAHKPN